MKLTISRKALYEGLQIVSRAVSTHTSLPVLKNVLIEPGTNAVKLCATDLDLGVEVLAPAQIQESGSLTVPARTLAEIVAALPEADVSLASDDQNHLVLCCRRADYRIHGLPADEFPSLPEVGGDVVFSIAQPLFKEIIRQTVLAASSDDTRPMLTGVYTSLEDKHLRLVATDTHRLAFRDAEVKEGSGTATVIIPKRALGELERVLEDDEEQLLQVRLGQNQALFKTETVTLITRLIEGQFPKYERVVPTQWQRRLTIPREEFQSVVRRARIVARDASAANRVVLRTEGENLVVTAEAGEVGKAYEELEVVREGDDIEIAFNASYLLDVAGVLDSEGLYLEMNEPLTPAVIRPVGGAAYLMVIMPMQVQ
ncbi:MAG: DNA polymerase III subunit beta [Armatimonadetes bacterium]|nr:DNA polymerase III subunit beta [Armatimonadota bacterium]